MIVYDMKVAPVVHPNQPIRNQIHNLIKPELKQMYQMMNKQLSKRGF